MAANKPTQTAQAVTTNPQADKHSSSLATSIFNLLPLSILLPIAFNAVLNTIKDQNSQKAKELEQILIPFGQALAQKYPQICSNSNG